MTAALIAILIAASSPADLHLDPLGKQSVSFTLHHPLHNVRGVTEEVEGKAKAFPDGTVEVEVRVALPSFRIGSTAIKEDFLELMDAARFPDVVVRAIVPPLADVSEGTAIDVETSIKIELHGRTRTFPATVKIARGPGDQVGVSGHFVVELHDFGIETPRYMFIDASPTVLVAVDLAWLREKALLLVGLESAAVEVGGSGKADGGASVTVAVQDAGVDGGPTVSVTSGGSTGAASDAGSATFGGGSSGSGSIDSGSGGGSSGGANSSSGGVGDGGADGGPTAATSS